MCAVTAIAFTQTLALVSEQWYGEQAHCTGSALTKTTDFLGDVAAVYSPIVALGAGILSANPYTVIDAGWEHACGIGVYGLLECFGDVRLESAYLTGFDDTYDKQRLDANWTLGPNNIFWHFLERAAASAAALSSAAFLAAASAAAFSAAASATSLSVAALSAAAL